MAFSILRFSALCGVFALVVGCGGSSGSGSGSGSFPTVVTFTISGATPTAVATQVGSGPFTAAKLASGAVTISVPSGTTNFAVAFVCPFQPLGENQQFVYEASTLDGNSYSEGCTQLATTAASSGILTGSVDASAIPGVSNVNIFALNGGSSAFQASQSPDSSFDFSAPSGTDRVEVLAYNQVGSLVAAENFSSQTVPGTLNGGNTVVLGAADETMPEAITFSGLPSGFGAPSGGAYYSISGADVLIPLSGDAARYPALPASAMQSGDRYDLNFSSYNSSTGEAIEVLARVTTPSPLSIPCPPAWSFAGPAPAALPIFDLAYSGFSGAANLYDLVDLTWTAADGNMTRSRMEATSNYLNGSTSVTLPNLSNLSGFLAPPSSGTTVMWTAGVEQSSFVPSIQSIPAGGTVVGVTSGGGYLVP